ncbi:MAG: trehalose-phosphatase [Longimicrobiaceae bacterium]
MAKVHLPHAFDRLPDWTSAWRGSGALVLLLDFDGTLAPIVKHADQAVMPKATREALTRLRDLPGVRLAVVSGRGLADLRARFGVPGVTLAGNHGMEIEGPRFRRVHEAAAAARPDLKLVAADLHSRLDGVAGAWVEDKGLTLSVHFREAAGAEQEIREVVERTVGGRRDRLRVTEGKMVLEVRPKVDWDKGRAASFLLEKVALPRGAPILYLGDDRTDEDAFRVLAPEGGEGVFVGLPEEAPALAGAYLQDPARVGEFLRRLAAGLNRSPPRNDPPSDHDYRDDQQYPGDVCQCPDHTAEA